MFRATAQRAIKNAWDGKVEPFAITDNLYFVGTYQASSHLIDTGDGLILIDTGYAETLYLVVDSIRALGFDPKDIKYIINTHWHGDHTAATAAMAGISGAKTLIGEPDFEKAQKYFCADILIHEGDSLSLGNTKIDFVMTPGHTKGTISFFFDSAIDGKVYRVGSFGGAGANTLVPEHFDFDGCREAYFASLSKLREQHVDIFIGNHTWNNDTEGKGKHLRESGENLFVDPLLWGKFLDSCKLRLENIIAAENK